MRSFWDRRAREDPFFFVDSRLRYGDPDRERFWSRGEADLDALLGTLGARLRRSDVVVELGCGIGRLTRAIAARSARVIAVDVSGEMLAAARAENPDLGNVDWLLGDGVSLRQVPSGAADACISHVVFQHIPDPAITLGYVREMGRVLRAGGWSAFQVSTDPAVHRLPPVGTRLRRGLRSAIGRAPRGQAAPAWRGSAVDLSELEEAAREAGMRVERVVGAGSQYCGVLARREP
jgi:SAM-dependent methyltransferase